MVVANMIGAGVFTTSGYALADLGSPHRVFAVWIVGGVIAICGAFSYGTLVRQICQSGGEYLFLSRMVHPAAGFIAGWVSLLAGFTGAIAFAATTFEVYVLPHPEVIKWLPAKSVALALIVICGLLHAAHIRVGAVSQNVIVAVKLGVLAVFAALAGLSLARHGFPSVVRSPQPFMVSVFASSLVWVSLAYSGFNAAVYIADEVQDAPHTVPRSLIWGTVIVTVVYLVLNAIFVYCVPNEVVVGQANVAAVAAAALGGSGMALVIRLGICLALASSVSSMLQAGPRVIVKMSEDGLLPRLMQPGPHGAPSMAVLLQMILAAVVVCLTDLQQLLSYLGFTLSISAACTVASLFLPAQRSALLKSPWLLLIAAFYVLATLLIASVAASHRPAEMAAAVATILSGLVAYGAIRWYRGNDGY